MLIIGICGASGSGKSTLAREIVRKIQKKCVLLSQDAYYRDHANLPFEERAKVNYDEPGVFEHDELLYDMKLLSEGKSITVRIALSHAERTLKREETQEVVDAICAAAGKQGVYLKMK